MKVCEIKFFKINLLWFICYNHSTLGCYSSSNRRYANRCSISSIERLLSSSNKFERLLRQNGNGLINNRTVCFRCCDTIRQIEQIQNNIDQFNNDKQILMNKIEHNLSKRALILQGQRQRANIFLTNHQVFSIIKFLSFFLIYKLFSLANPIG